MSTRSASQIRQHTDFLHQYTTDFAIEINAHPPGSSTKDFLVTIESFMISINDSFLKRHDPLDFIEADLHYIWHMAIEVAKITDPGDTTHNSLVLLLLYFKELGTLRQVVDGVEQEAVMNNGERLWTDLPFFASDLLAVWKQSVGMIAKQRTNLAAFTGKCVAHGVGGANNVLSTSWLLKGLEEDRELDILVVELVHACTALLQNCYHKLLKLCNSNDSQFSMVRWLSWRKRLQELSRSEDKNVAEEAKRGFDIMINCGREMGYIVEGEEKYWAKVTGLLVDELKRSGKESVGLEDIVTDPAWADEE